MTPVFRREVCAATWGSFSRTAMRPSYRFASQYANEVPRIPPPTIVTSQGSMSDFEEPSGVYYGCARTMGSIAVGARSATSSECVVLPVHVQSDGDRGEA